MDHQSVVQEGPKYPGENNAESWEVFGIHLDCNVFVHFAVVSRFCLLINVNNL